MLVDDGWDVWLENWRASIDLPPTQWTLDEAAVYDHPALIRTVVAETGADSVKAVVHCQGSTSFAMSAAAGLLPEVTTIVSNAVSLHPRIPGISNAKIQTFTPAVGTAHVVPQSPLGTGRAEPARQDGGGGRAADPSRVRQHRLPAGQLHVRRRLPLPVVAREPVGRHPRLDRRRVRRRLDRVLHADGRERPAWTHGERRRSPAVAALVRVGTAADRRPVRAVRRTRQQVLLAGESGSDLRVPRRAPARLPRAACRAELRPPRHVLRRARAQSMSSPRSSQELSA